MCVRGQFGRRDTQQGLGGLEHRFQRGLVGIVIGTQPVHFQALLLGDIGVHLFQPIAIVRLKIRAREFGNAGQQTVALGERLGLDDEVARDLVGLQLDLSGDVLQRIRDGHLECGGVALRGRDGLRCRHHDRQQIGPFATAVHVDLVHHRTVGVLGFQCRDRDELALGQFEYVVAAIDDLDVVVGEFGDNIAGHVETVVVEDARGHLGALVVAEEHTVGLQQQLTARMWLVGGEVPQLGHIDELVFDDRRALDDSVAEHHAGLGGSITVGQMQLEARLDEFAQLFGQRCRAHHDRQDAATKEVVPNLGLDLCGHRV
ncbi:hypothetical protein CCUG60884_04211 [Mycobacteroides salmoniphilum]|uniref:NAD-specific glutamate dehydrogenase n=1 Tax=Mycobacteroides salmoniphilum TaxID=404941 RepID=A0A4R8SPS9_9MYCO|nr:hypothetical protein CCUG60884_04211 [Mycobacteroides salmoniphilum]